ncbi:MAG: propanediol utilization protein [Elusimicrobia bacterium]|nr:MAG: propanediol utilization protein [Elusimicrobiota bacterium]KAF0158222.1 MAG: propanediol utilization protein [Elusimicrobiota bacterium]
MDEKLVREIVEDLKLRQERSSMPVPVGISNRHFHITKEHFKALFGADAEPCRFRRLRQPGFYACDELITVEGPKGALKNVRLIGPYRPYTQIEVSLADARTLGIDPPIRDSGKLDNSPGVKLTGPKGSVTLDRGVILSKRHIHFHPKDAERMKIKDGMEVRVRCGRGDRAAVYEGVLCRVSEKYALELHLDTEEANAAGLRNNDPAYIV